MENQTKNTLRSSTTAAHRGVLTFTIYILCLFEINAQTVVYQDVFYGGASGSGGFGYFPQPVNFSILIPPGSTIRKAFFISARDGNYKDITIAVNGIPYKFDNSNIVTDNFISLLMPNPFNSSIYLIDVTSSILSTINNYSISIPFQPIAIDTGYFNFFYLYVAYENLSMPKINTFLCVNNQNVSNLSNYNLQSLNPINNNYPVGLELMTTSICDTTQDGAYVKVNNYNIGLIGGIDYTSPVICSGPYPSFGYFNNNLIGLADDTPNAFMEGTDATADIQGYINNLDTAINLSIIQQFATHAPTTTFRGAALTYTTPCDTFSVNLLTEDTTVCRGDSVQLGVVSTSSTTPKYEWLPQKDLSCYTCANPVFSGDSSQVYTVRIWNTDSCSKVLPVRVRVLPLPSFGKITTQNTICGSSTGSLTAAAINNTQDSLFIDSLWAGLTPHTQNNLGSGQYHLYLKDSNGCVSKDTLVSINATNNTEALFTVNPQTGAAPLSVSTDNQSTHATDYLWYFLNDSTTAFAPNIQFDTSGTYTVTLVAYQNDIACADTFSLSVTVYDSLQIIVPNIFTPNGDGQNDVFSIQVNTPCQGTVNIFNRWGNEVFTKDFEVTKQQASATLSLQDSFKIPLWDGLSNEKQVSEGVYFYQLHLTDKAGEGHDLQGFVSVVR